jgi:hypothetical protein
VKPWQIIEAYCHKIKLWVNRNSKAYLIDHNLVKCKMEIPLIEVIPMPFIPSHIWKNNSIKMLSSLTKLQTLMNKNKYWYKLNGEGKGILEKMSMNQFDENLSFNSKTNC